MEIKNAKIRETMLGIEDHGCLTYLLTLDYGGAQQGFGQYVLDDFDEGTGKRIGRAYGAETIRRILETLEVDEWEKLPGTPCRVEAELNKIKRLGHFLKDKWFDPKQLAKEMKVTNE